jgi:hypothetical protein
VIFIGPGLVTEAVGATAVEVLADGGVEGPLAHAALAAVNDNAAVIVRIRVLTSHTVTPPMACCLPALFSFCSGTLC